jgi:hypothetical protein
MLRKQLLAEIKEAKGDIAVAKEMIRSSKKEIIFGKKILKETLVYLKGLKKELKDKNFYPEKLPK